MALRRPVGLLLLFACRTCSAVKRKHVEMTGDLDFLGEVLFDLGVGASTNSKVCNLARAALKPPTDGLRQVAKIKPLNAERDLQRWIARQEWHTYEFKLNVVDKLGEETHKDRACGL